MATAVQQLLQTKEKSNTGTCGDRGPSLFTSLNAFSQKITQSLLRVL